MMSIKALLTVRQTAANDISLLEIGIPLKQWLKKKNPNFLKQALHHREGLDDDSLTFVISLKTAAKTSTGLYCGVARSCCLGFNSLALRWTRGISLRGTAPREVTFYGCAAT